jgi:hypothetical protein
MLPVAPSAARSPESSFKHNAGMDEPHSGVFYWERARPRAQKYLPATPI